MKQNWKDLAVMLSQAIVSCETILEAACLETILREALISLEQHKYALLFRGDTGVSPSTDGNKQNPELN